MYNSASLNQYMDSYATSVGSNEQNVTENSKDTENQEIMTEVIEEPQQEINLNENEKVELSEYITQLYDSMSGLGTDEEKFYKVLNNENLSNDDWVDIINEYNQQYGVDLVSMINSDFSTMFENNERNQIMEDLASKLTTAIENNNQQALNIACKELFNALGGNIPKARKGTANEFAQNLILNSSDEIRAQISRKYSRITGSNLISDIEKCTDISKANKDLMINQINLTKGFDSSAIEKVNVNAYDIEQQNKAKTLNLMIDSLNSEITSFIGQNKEDGEISGDLNAIKALLGVGVSSEDATEALELQQQDIQRLAKALNTKDEEYFKKTFKEITGVEYNEEKIIDFQEKAIDCSLLTAGLNKTDSFIKNIEDANNLEDAYKLYADYFGNEQKAREEFNKMLEYGFQQGFSDGAFGYQKNPHIDEEGNFVADVPQDVEPFAIDIQNPSYNQQSMKMEDMPNIFKTCSRYFDFDSYKEQYTKSIESITGKTSEEIFEEYANSKKAAFGNFDKLEQVVNKYCQSQDAIIDKVSSYTQIGGMGLMAVGGVLCLSPTTLPIGVETMTAGKYMALGGMFGNNALDIADNLSSTNGLNKEELKENLTEAIKEIGYLELGQGINKVAELAQKSSLEAMQGLKAMGFSDKAIKGLSWAVEGTTDLALSALSDKIITGDVNLEGNSIQVLMGILTGIASSKAKTYQAKLENMRQEEINYTNDRIEIRNEAQRLRQENPSQFQDLEFENTRRTFSGDVSDNEANYIEHLKRIQEIRGDENHYKADGYSTPPGKTTRQQYKAILDVQFEEREYTSVERKLRLGEELNTDEFNFLNNVLRNMEPSKEDMVLWRAFTMHEGFEEQIKSGIISFDNITSTSKSYNNDFIFDWAYKTEYSTKNPNLRTISPGLVLKINAPEGTNMLDCNVLYHGKGNRMRAETILPPSICKVDKVDTELNVIEVTIIK